MEQIRAQSLLENISRSLAQANATHLLNVPHSDALIFMSALIHTELEKNIYGARYFNQLENKSQKT